MTIKEIVDIIRSDAGSWAIEESEYKTITGERYK